MVALSETDEPVADPPVMVSGWMVVSAAAAQIRSPGTTEAVATPPGAAHVAVVALVAVGIYPGEGVPLTVTPFVAPMKLGAVTGTLNVFAVAVRRSSHELPSKMWPMYSLSDVLSRRD